MTINRNHKDRFFRLVFGREEYKGNLLSLYNALSGKNYTNLDDLTINTIDDFIYMGMKNDVSFLISHELTMIEQQTSHNPNMPLRGLLYFAKLYEKYIIKDENRIYSSSLVKLPFPRYYVLYNGTDKNLPERTELRLSDAFANKTSDEPACLECRATVLNINVGKNRELLDNCQPLLDYSTVIQRIRDFREKDLDKESAVTEAVDSCIRDGILSDILTAHKAEAIGMLFRDYDEEGVKKVIYEDGLAEGLEKGLEKGRAEGYAEGHSEGVASTMAEVIKAMVIDLDSDEKIMRITKCSQEMIDQIRKTTSVDA